MTDRLRGKVALITGTASPNGIGFATARRFVEEGCHVVLADLDIDMLRARQAELGKDRVEVQVLDVTEETQWRDCCADISKVFGGLDILVNNAGIIRLDPVEQIDQADWQRMIDVNLKGTYLGVKHAAGHLRQRGGGSIVNLSSVAGLIATPGCGAYAATKGGVRLFTKCAALDLAKDRIRVNSVHPGFIQTDMQHDVRKGLDEADYDKAQDHIPLGRAGTPAEVADLILFLASDESTYVTASEFVIDGGLSAT